MNPRVTIINGSTGGFRGEGAYTGNQSFDNSAQVKGNSQGHTFNGVRNLRTVWTLTTEAFPEAHFATYPTKLVEPCIKAGTSEHGVCATCGAPWERVVERVSAGKSYATGKSDAKRGAGLATAFSGYDDGSAAPEFKTVGWQPTCFCDSADRVPATVLDPFSGAGTAGLVAHRLGRSYLGIEMNPAYCAMAERRIREDAPMFAAPEVVLPAPILQEDLFGGNGHAPAPADAEPADAP